MSYFRIGIRITFVIVLAIILGSAISYLMSTNRPLAVTGESVQFTVEKGEGPRTIAENLVKAGYLPTDRVFLIYAVMSGSRDRFYPGTYVIRATDTIKTLTNAMTSGKEDQSRLTVLEGWRINDIAKAIAKKTTIAEEAFLTAAPVDEYEGYLFPDTYYFSPETTAEQAVKIMRDNYDRKTANLGVTEDDLILASIVERETQRNDDRPMVAAVYLNRLKINMALEADPTVQYAKGSWDQITLADYRSTISPYNTYLNRGLPPGPISNPGLEAIKAVKTPAEHNYYYFFHADGKTYFSSTLDEHNTNKRKYLH